MPPTPTPTPGPTPTPTPSVAIPNPKNIIGFIQPNIGNTYPTLNQLMETNYNILVEGFLINYPYCWGNGQGRNSSPGVGNRLSVCNGIIEGPGPATNCKIYREYFSDNDLYLGNDAPRPDLLENKSGSDSAYEKYYKSLHLLDPFGIQTLKKNILNSSKPIELLLSIGGWNMGGSTVSGRFMPSDPTVMSPIGYCLQEPAKFAEELSSLLRNFNIKDALGTVHNVYDGFDIDIETTFPFARDGKNDDPERIVEPMVNWIVEFKKLDKDSKYKISTSPRATDICDEHGNLEFMGKVIKNLRDMSPPILFDYINPQFYNDEEEKNIPKNGTTPGKSAILQLIEIIKLSPSSDISVGVLSQNDNRDIDASIGNDNSINPGVHNDHLVELWKNIIDGVEKTDTTRLGLMNWFVNMQTDSILQCNEKSPGNCDDMITTWGNGFTGAGNKNKFYNKLNNNKFYNNKFDKINFY